MLIHQNILPEHPLAYPGKPEQQALKLVIQPALGIPQNSSPELRKDVRAAYLQEMGLEIVIPPIWCSCFPYL